ncbi:unnamed protein product [Victoria cruziana]
MILKYSLLGNLLLLWMNIVNSIVMVGLYYGFLTIFSMEGSKKEVLATTAFIMGQFIVFISTYYPPLHLALNRPHTLTVFVILYLLFYFLFFWNNKKSLFDDRSTHKNFIPNLVFNVFLNNLIFQLSNHFILPSSTLTRLVDISMSPYKNKILFVTSSFFGWLIGHMLLMKCTGLVLSWPWEKMRSNAFFRSNKYLMSKWRNFVSQIFSIILFIICEAYGSVEEDLSISLEEEERWNLYKNIYEAEEIWLNGKEKHEFDLKEKEKNELLWIEKSLLISFTYPPSLSTFFEMIQKKINNLRNEFINRIEAINKGYLIFDVVEKRARLCNNEEEQECLPKFYDPLLNGPYRGTIEKGYLYSIRNDSTTSTRWSTKMGWINKIYELEHEIDKLDVKSSSTGIEDSSVSIGELTEETEEAEKSRTFPRWLYKLTSDLDFVEEEEEKEEDDQEKSTDDHGIPEECEIALIRYSQQSDFHRDLIKGSMWAQRCKIVTWEMFQIDVHSPIFFDRIDNTHLFSFDISTMMNLIFRNWIEEKSPKIKTYDYRKNTNKKKGSIKEKRIKDMRRNG